jgi:hypothetical protein
MLASGKQTWIIKDESFLKKLVRPFDVKEGTMKLRKLLAVMILMLSPLVIIGISLMIPDLLAVLGVMLLTQGQGPATQLAGILLLIPVLWYIFGFVPAIFIRGQITVLF